jgi:hypothetical protein
MKSSVTLVLVTTVLTFAVGFGVAGCDADLDTNREVEAYGSFGEIVYREACQRTAYLGQLSQKAAGQRDTVDVSGSLGKAVCIADAQPPDDAPEKLKEIQIEKSPLVVTVDAILPKPFLSDLQDFMVAIVPLNDDQKDGTPGVLPQAITSLGTLLDTMAKDPDFTPALARLAQRGGYRPTKTAAGLVHTVIEYPQIDDFLGKTLELMAPGGTAETEFKTLLTAMSMELRSAAPAPDPDDNERTLKLGLKLLLDTHPDLVTGTARPLVKRDFRGLAIPAQVAAPFVDTDGDGLADVDSLGRFVDAAGMPVAVATPFPELGATDAAPRDAQGRALTATGASTTIWNYLNLDGTVLSGLAHETHGLTDPNSDKVLGLAYGMSALLGPRTTQTKMYMDPAGGMLGALTYNGFDTSQAPIVDLLHAFVQLLGDPNADTTLQATATLLDKYESPTARAIGGMLDASDRGKLHPEALLSPTATIYDDLAPIIVRILRVPALAQDLVNTMRNRPDQVKHFARITAWLMQSRNQVDFIHSDVPRYLIDPSSIATFDGVDRTKYDVDYNRSLMQRIAHMIHDANGVTFCNKEQAAIGFLGLTLYHDRQCELFKIDDLALFYILNMASDSVRKNPAYPSAYHGANFCEHIYDSTAMAAMNLFGADSFLEGSNGTHINGFRCYPSPQALNRSLFLKQNEQSQFMQDTTDPLTCKDGDRFTDVHDKSIFAWELAFPDMGNDTFYTAIQPLVDAFARHDECVQYDASMNCLRTQNAAKIFVDLMAMLHEHWSSPQGSYFGHQYQPNKALPRYAHTDNVVSYEKLLAEILDGADLVPAVVDLAPTLATFTVDGTAGGTPALPSLISTAGYIFNPDAARAAGVTYRDGSTTTVQSDGVTFVPSASVYHMFADAYARKRAALNGAGPDAQSWKIATSALVDQMLTITQSGGTYQFANRNFRAISLRVVDFLRGRIAHHANAGDLATWVHQTMTQNATDMMGGPVMAALGDFSGKITADPDARTQLYGLLNYLVNQANDDLVFQTALTALADQVQTFMDDPDLVPVAHVLGAALDPDTSTVDKHLTLVKKSRDVDAKHALLTILRNLYKQDAAGVYPASTLADVLAQLDRAHPLDTAPLSGDDYKNILIEARDFLLDNQRGLTRFIAIIKNRGPHN